MYSTRDRVEGVGFLDALGGIGQVLADIGLTAAKTAADVGIRYAIGAPKQQQPQQQFPGGVYYAQNQTGGTGSLGVVNGSGVAYPGTSYINKSTGEPDLGLLYLASLEQKQSGGVDQNTILLIGGAALIALIALR